MSENDYFPVFLETRKYEHPPVGEARIPIQLVPRDDFQM
jgi:hypothetical protein